MAFTFTDRQSAYPNRYKVTTESGESYYLTLERADEPTVVGTALNAETFNALIAQLSEAGHKHAAGDITSGTLPVARGGTGSSNGATGLKNLFAAGNTILSSYQYGTSLPSPGHAGRIFFKRVSG